MNLYQINKALADKMTKLGELLMQGATPTQEQENELIDLQGDLADKLISYGYVVKNLSGELDAVDSEIKRLSDIKKAKARQIDMLKGRMQMAMVDNGLSKIDDPVMPISLRTNPPSVQLSIDPDRLPKEFVKIKLEADKTALKTALKNGQQIDGASLVSGQSIKVG